MQLLNPEPTSSKSVYWHNLHGAAKALAISEHLSSNQFFNLVLTADASSTEILSQQIKFFAPNLEVLSFPDWETLPYDYFSPHQDIISQRISTLYKLPNLRQGVLLVPISTLLQRITPRSFVAANAFIMQIGDKLDLHKLRTNLESAGYRAVQTVYGAGEFAVRGAIIDIFPTGCDQAIRIELFDDEIESLRTFDVETQLTISKIKKVDLLPAREFAFDQNTITDFRHNFRQRFTVDLSKCSIYQDVTAQIAFGGIEYYLPLFFPQTETLFDYLPANTVIFNVGAVHQAAEQFITDVNARFNERKVDNLRPLLKPTELFLTVEECFAQLKNYQQIHLDKDAAAQDVNFQSQKLPNVEIDAKNSHPFANLQAFINDFAGKILFCAESLGRCEALLEILTRINVNPTQVTSWQQFLAQEQRFSICVSHLDDDLFLANKNIAVISESSLFGRKIIRNRKKNRTNQSDNLIKNLAEISIGTPVVHVEHGVGKYLGLVSMEYDGNQSEFIALEYADEAKLYVPVTNLHLISRYAGADDISLNRLGTDHWNKAKRKAARQVRDIAAELLDVYARRAARQGFSFNDPKADYITFAADFAFEETIDQAAAIEAVRADMLSAKPMDRLICGDVGFGKTEVAMRAAFIAVHSGKQVAVLVPTTLLADQHYHSFKDRFAAWPVVIESISRFKSAKEVNQIIKQLEAGTIDILIGTHKLLQSSVKFKNLGLLIIDEEHRFGVRQKEQLKALRSEVDILTLTATPIPRTLNMAVAGMRDLSIIATAPARRLAVKTFVARNDSILIKDAILRELQRGGQVYYLHNEVRTIEQCATKIAELVPNARIAVGHGQMPERDLERVMSDFYHQRFNILVASTIIETGIDVPTANTIIIDRADKFGLAQLHQLRGRVGRSYHQAYAYLLVPAEAKITADAQKRLDAIVAAEDLGAGFILATHDLEIRGAGELLGEGQSGQIHAVGFSLYMEMLEQAIKSLQSGKKITDEIIFNFGADINLHIPALIPDDYLPDVHERLILYKRIASSDETGLHELQVEMIDRFGLLPEVTKNLIQITKLKLMANMVGISKIDIGAKGGKIEFSADTKVNPAKLIALIQKQPQIYQLFDASSVKLRVNLEDFAARYDFCINFIKALKG